MCKLERRKEPMSIELNFFCVSVVKSKSKSVLHFPSENGLYRKYLYMILPKKNAFNPIPIPEKSNLT